MLHTSSPAKLMLQKEFQTMKRCPVSSDYYIHDLRNDNLFGKSCRLLV